MLTLPPAATAEPPTRPPSVSPGRVKSGTSTHWSAPQPASRTGGGSKPPLGWPAPLALRARCFPMYHHPSGILELGHLGPALVAPRGPAAYAYMMNKYVIRPHAGHSSSD
eukprot:5326795-Prymnesium_polylepis.1